MFDSLSVIPFRLTVTDYLSQSASMSVLVSKSSDPLPMLFIQGNSGTQSLYRANVQRLVGYTQLSPCAQSAGGSWAPRWRAGSARWGCTRTT